MHNIEINGDVYLLPENWDELSADELQYLARITQQEMPLETVKVYMLLYCLKAHVAPHKKRFGDRSLVITLGGHKRKYLFTPEEINNLGNIFSFLFEKENDAHDHTIRYYIKPIRFINPFPSLVIQKETFTGPDDGLYDITFEQFIYMQTYLDAMRQDAQKLSPLLACLWHRGERFDINKLETDTALLHQLPDTTKMVMYWFITGCIINLGEQFPRVFSGSGSVSRNVFDSQLRLLDTLAGSDMTKKDAVRQGKFMDALYSMDESIRRQEEMEEKIRNH